jgi:hypothetical protein
MKPFAPLYGLWLINFVGAAVRHVVPSSPRFYVLQAGLLAVVGLALWFRSKDKTPAANKHVAALVALSVALDLAVATGLLNAIPG